LNITEPGDYTVQAYFAGKPVGAPTEITVDQQDVELKAPVAVAKAGDKSKDAKAESAKTDKPEEK
jgi:hypothetical protein